MPKDRTLSERTINAITNEIEQGKELKPHVNSALQVSLLIELRDLKTSFNSQNSEIKAIKRSLVRQERQTNTLINLLKKIEDNTNPNPKINAPSKRVDFKK